MTYELAHRPRTESGAKLVTVEAPTSWASVEQLGAGIPEEYIILYVRRLD
ncbi:hypothetical protein [Clavibacter michiganensis]|nr:hypothetical protein [Clavibacter michiganensis]MDO4030247.1 hypothetical protein [Clavibacter michiganensis]MDO4045678.1 hypothetical protein [Clavibacter michiganensis]MDO4054741.1 hypothetical protein [Clavibacter michiganensis]MDO4058142.1 hypothetical protein [Clavibacter michiganensis]UOW05286.1 hypothetical protein MU580_16000 [Clavibacter michiganensis subsp. michiganensis]